MLIVFKKLILLNVPTLCLMNGKTYAGGLFLSLCHDFRIMVSDGKICLNEVSIGAGFSTPYV